MNRTILRVVVAAAIACAALAALLPWEPLRLAAALPLVFFLPGYAIVAASFGRRPPEGPDLIVLSLGCSLSVVALGGLALNYVPGGIDTASWAILLGAVTVIAAVVAGRRDFVSNWKSVRRPGVRLGDAAFVLVALVLAAAAVVLANRPLGAESAGRYTALWMLPPADTATDTVTIGVESAERTRRVYRLKVEAGETPAGDLGDFVLQPGGKRVFHVSLLDRPVGRPVHVTAVLYRKSDPADPYRKVRVWLPAEAR